MRALVSQMRLRGRDDSGQIIVLTTVLLVVLIGFMGLAIDGGHMFQYQIRMQTAADAGAVSGAFEKDQILATVQSMARGAATMNGFTHGADSIDVAVNRPPTQGPYVGNNGYVEVIITQPRNTFFMAIMGHTSMTVRARAVAGWSDAAMCVLVLDPTGSAAMSMTGEAIANSPNCAVQVNSSASGALSVTGQSSLIANEINVVGTRTGGGFVSPTPNTGAPVQIDPYLGLATPATPSPPCNRSAVRLFVTTVATLDPGEYCGGLQVEGGGLATFNPGMYIINGGDLTIRGGVDTAGTPPQGISFYVTGGKVDISGTAAKTFRAPRDGAYQGILIFVDRTMPTSSPFNLIQGGSNMVMEGVIYAPSTTVSYSGGSITAAYMAIISWRLQLLGSVTFNNTFSLLQNGSPIKRYALAE